MFEGSQHHDHGYFQPLQGAGASLNGSTNADRTNYWEVVPTNALELALWMESDRMGYLLPALTDAKFANQRDVVLNERRQNYENRPYGLAAMAIARGAVSAGSSVSLDDDRRRSPICRRRSSTTCARSSRRYYHPANASLALAGDIDPEQALALVERLLRRDRRRADRVGAGRAAAPRCRRGPAAARGSRRAAAALPGVALAGDVRRRATPSSISRPTCWPTARRRGCIARWSTSSGSRPTCRRRRTRARSAASSRSPPPPRPATRWPSSSAPSSRRSRGARRRRADRATRSSAAARRPRRSSSSACRRSAASAASPIS